MWTDQFVLSVLDKQRLAKNEREIELPVLLGLSWSQTGGGWLHIFCAFFGIYLLLGPYIAVKEIICKFPPLVSIMLLWNVRHSE